MTATTVVLIEDSAVFMGLLTAFVEHAEPQGVRIVGAARSGEDGLTLATRVRPTAAIVDLKLPDISGLEVITRLRSTDPRVAIVALTGADPAAFREPALLAGADAFVRKDQMNTDLIPALLGAVSARANPVPSGDQVDG
jgi:two-component system, NarL family, nitrate/nitrite response regulator NarL